LISHLVTVASFTLSLKGFKLELPLNLLFQVIAFKLDFTAKGEGSVAQKRDDSGLGGVEPDVVGRVPGERQERVSA